MTIFIIVSCFINVYGDQVCHARGRPFANLADCRTLAASLNAVDEHRSVPTHSVCYKKAVPAWEPAD
jgi:hypothetical protein